VKPLNEKNRHSFLFLLFLLILLTACSQETERTAKEKESPAFLDVQLSIQPEEGKVNEPLLFRAKVTYGDEIVTDADEVEFEIWQENDDYHEKIVVEHVTDGIYQLEKSFSEAGTYYVYAHVTAKDMHNMPKKEFEITE
jgi:hypothetical protein